MATTTTSTTDGSVVKVHTTGTADAQVSPDAPAGTPTTVVVDETQVSLDQVILDPDSVDAVQEGPAGDTVLPIEGLLGQKPEDVFPG